MICFLEKWHGLLGPSFSHFGTLTGPELEDPEDTFGLEVVVLVEVLVEAAGGSSYVGGWGRSSARAKTDWSRGAGVLTSSEYKVNRSFSLCVMRTHGSKTRPRISSAVSRLGLTEAAVAFDHEL